MDRPPRLLLVEDDQQLAVMLTELLEGEGYDVQVARDGQRGLHLGLTQELDVIVLDRGLPAIEGLDLLTRLRARGRTAPALVLSAQGNPSDRVEGLDAGAEDYLGKPFDVEELLARLRGLLRRNHEHAEIVGVPGGRLDLDTRSVLLDDGGEVQLSEREAMLLTLLAHNPRRVFSREELLASVFQAAEDDGVVDTYVHYVRRKLGRGVVETVRGLGYRMGR